jgi:hypothetical protein
MGYDYQRRIKMISQDVLAIVIVSGVAIVVGIILIVVSVIQINQNKNHL